MLIKFSVKYATVPGESVTIRFAEGKVAKQMEVTLKYADENHWEGSINSASHPMMCRFRYSVVLKKENLHPDEKILVTGKINLEKYKADNINIIHENMQPDNFTQLSRTKPFKELLKQKNCKSAKAPASKNITHIFKAEFPVLQENKFICLTGNAKMMHGFNPKMPLLFKKRKNNKSSLKMDLSKEAFPLEYKIAVYDCDNKTIIDYEPGENHILAQSPEKKSVCIIHTDYSFEKFAWKGAGINIPVFSLRSENSWGTGDFTDLYLLVDYASCTGLKLIQLLPVNDTTSSHTENDSYPYSAISAFALDPKFMNVEKLAQTSGVDISSDEQLEIKRLNGLPCCDHEGVMKLKTEVLKRIFEKEKDNFRDNNDWVSFFERNKEWLVPYAVFCTFRDNHGTSDYATWEGYEIYREDKVQELFIPGNKDYYSILFWYFNQYHLHLQLKDAKDYAHKKRIILKADLPIGAGRYSADTWVYPELFDMKMQIGAPPDAFSSLGQNWEFPAYNMQQMAFDDYAWFRKRLKHLEYYFDAVRIDHVLGFFRIWNIPVNQTDGRMGRFVPAIPLAEHDFTNEGLALNEERYCDPFITEELLEDKFGLDKVQVKQQFFKSGKLLPAFNEQQKIRTYFKDNPKNNKWQQQLTDIVANVILFRDKEIPGGYHFRINMQQTESFAHLPEDDKSKLNSLYEKYFYQLQNELWKCEGKEKLQMLKDSTDMLLCAEDLGMVPAFTEEVLHSLDILSLQVQQMPKEEEKQFSDTAAAVYESVVTPATHDMAPIRLWWELNRKDAQLFFNDILKEKGITPYFCEPWICEKIINMHLNSPAMWSIFLLQDLLSINGSIRRPNPNEERINNPANGDNIWNYRMHLTLENLLAQKEFNAEVKTMIKESGR